MRIAEYGKLQDIPGLRAGGYMKKARRTGGLFAASKGFDGGRTKVRTWDPYDVNIVLYH